MHHRGVRKLLDLKATQLLRHNHGGMSKTPCFQTQTKLHGALGKGASEIRWVATRMIATKVLVGELIRQTHPREVGDKGWGIHRNHRWVCGRYPLVHPINNVGGCLLSV